MNKIKKQRFTLIELLLVMGLMGLMVTLALPAFSRMAGNNKIDIMTSNIKTALEQGQSTAVSRNCYVAVVFPNSDCQKKIAEYAFGGYRLAEVKSDDDETFTFVRWINDDYMNKPEGAYLAAVQITKLKVGTDSVGAKFVNSGLKTISGLDDGITGNVAVIFKSTGECKNSNLYFVIASGNVTVEDIEKKKDNEAVKPELETTKATDYRQLYLNQFTGRVDYVSDEEESSISNSGGDK